MLYSTYSKAALSWAKTIIILYSSGPNSTRPIYYSIQLQFLKNVSLGNL